RLGRAGQRVLGLGDGGLGVLHVLEGGLAGVDGAGGGARVGRLADGGAHRRGRLQRRRGLVARRVDVVLGGDDVLLAAGHVRVDGGGPRRQQHGGGLGAGPGRLRHRRRGGDALAVEGVLEGQLGLGQGLLVLVEGGQERRGVEGGQGLAGGHG